MVETENLGLKKEILDAAADITLFDENWDIIDAEVTAAKRAAENAGDMKAEIYDTDGDGVVDDASKLGGKLPEYYATNEDIIEANRRVTELEEKTDLLPVEKGGTGAKTPAEALEKLGIYISTNIPTMLADGAITFVVEA